MYKCKCCGNKTLPAPPEEAVAYICPDCWWENDVFITGENEPSDENHGLTLAEGRKNYEKYGICDPELNEPIPERIKKRTRKKLYIILSLIVFSLAVTFIDAFVHPPYFSKIPIKILFFLALPMLFFVFSRGDRSGFKSLFRFQRKGLLVSLLLGLAIFGVILGGYFALRGVIDFSGVTANLTEDMGITPENFLWVAIYISVMNSFLEEFFFRGFGFITLKKYTGVKFAYIFSPVLFAIYHIGMLVGMFELPALALLMVGLIAGGLIFNVLNDRFGNIYPSWFTHMAANFAINTIGFILFGMI